MSTKLSPPAQVADLRLALQRAEQQQARKEDYLREEISELQQVTAVSHHDKNRHASSRCCIGLEQEHTSHCPVILHRGFRRLRPGTRNSARASHQQRGPCCDRLRIYRRRWVGRQHPGKNWRKTSRIDWVRVPSYILLSDMSVGLWEDLFYYFFNPISGFPGTAGHFCGEGAFSIRRTDVLQVPAGLSGVPEFPVPPGKGTTPVSAGVREKQERETRG